MAPPTAKLEFSPDPLSDTTPTYTDITNYLVEAAWTSGKEKDLDDPQAGSATFRLKNTGRRFEPEYAAGAFYPNIRPGRRFRWTVGGVQQGIWYATSWDVQYPNQGNAYSEVVVSCSDGFWPLSLLGLPRLDATNAETYGEVVQSDDPIAHFPLDELAGKSFAGDPGPDNGQVKGGAAGFAATNPVLGESAGACLFSGTSGVTHVYGRALAGDKDVFKDAGQATLECVATVVDTDSLLIAFGYMTTPGDFQFALYADQIIVTKTGGADVTSPHSAGVGTHHYAATWDGSNITMYQDGVAVATGGCGALSSGDASEYFYIAGGHGWAGNGDVILSHAAFYDECLSATRIAAHATAALNRGYAQQLAGDRVDALATNALWSTAGIPAGQITVRAEMQTGQPTLDEIVETVKSETPIGLFYFDDTGNPDYRPWDEAVTILATFGDAGAEVRYRSIQLVYDDEVFNTSTASTATGLAQTATNTASVSEFGQRTQDETGLIIAKDTDAALIAQTIVDRFSTPQFRIASVDLNGADPATRSQILNREVGDYIRIKRRGEGGTPIDVITRILGKSKTLDVNRDLTCSWRLARGFNAASPYWHVGIPGYGEAGQTTVAG